MCTAKERSLPLVSKHKHVVEEGKMLLKLIAVDSYHFIRYKCKITHCPDSQTSEYISAIVLDDNEKLSTSEVLNVTVGSGTFTSTSSFGTQSLQFVTMNEFKKYVPGGFYLFTFYLAVQKCLLLSVFFEAHLIIDVRITFKQQKSHWVNFWWKHIKKESSKGYLGNKEQKAMFLVVSNMCTLVLRGPFGHAS